MSDAVDDTDAAPPVDPSDSLEPVDPVDPVGPADSVDSVSVTIRADAGDLWDMVSDVTRMGEWSPECTGGRWLGKRRGPEVGARFVGTNKRGWARWATTNEVVEADRGTAFAFRTRETGVIWAYRFAPAPEGGTVVTETRDLRQARTWLVRLAGPFVGGMDRHAEELREGMRQTLERLKAAAEAPTPSTD